jgi:hypothetical protein
VSKEGEVVPGKLNLCLIFPSVVRCHWSNWSVCNRLALHTLFASETASWPKLKVQRGLSIPQILGLAGNGAKTCSKENSAQRCFYGVPNVAATLKRFPVTNDLAYSAAASLAGEKVL